jgi:putative phosphoserine phosphatase / 1-acylglycerol-3-phosphate O-acyltransferase
MPSFSYTAFYDLDHTILDGNSATHLVMEARKRGVMSERQYRHAVWLSILYKLHFGDPTRMINRMLSWLRGMKEDAILNLANEIFHSNIKDTIRPAIMETIEEHRTNNGAIVLLSSATHPICLPVTQYMELDEIICTHLESKNGILTGHTSGKLVYGPEKKVRMLTYCYEKGSDPLKAWYYGDSHTDRYVMEAVGHPVAVFPDKRLLKIARRKNWPILR